MCSQAESALRVYSKQISRGMGDAQFLKARRSVMRLLQLSVNPTLALSAMANDDVKVDSAIVDQVLDEGHSAKMRAVMDHAYALARDGKKCVIWTIFTDTIHSFVSALADLNPVYIHGGVPSGLPSDPESREGRIRRFHEDPGCFVLVANPAAAGEGISLHTVCHNAIYADRSYVSTHYLQSIDRIHRLGFRDHGITAALTALIGGTMALIAAITRKAFTNEALLDRLDRELIADRDRIDRQRSEDRKADGDRLDRIETDIRSMGRNSAGVMGIRPRGDDYLVSLTVVQAEAQLLVASEKGLGKRTPFEDYPTKGRGGKGVITMNVTDKTGRVVGALRVTEDDDVMLMTDGGQSVRIPASQIRVTGRNAQGVKLMNLKEGEIIQDIARVVRDDDGDEEPDSDSSSEPENPGETA